MKKILVPCDFSNTAIQAFQFACEIAKASKGEIFLVNVVEFPVLHSSLIVPIKAYENAFLKEIKNKAIRNFEKIKERWGGKIKINFSVEQGSVASSVARFTSKKKIDLIVMGTHGSSGFREYAIGSNTEKIVRTSEVPVIAIKKTVKLSQLKEIVFPTDLKPGSKKLIDSVKALQSFLKARVNILYVNTPTNFSKNIATEKKLNEFAKQSQFKNYALHIYNDVNEESGIADFSSKFKNKLITMSTHGREGLSHLMNGSIAEDVVNHIDCPVWTYAS